MHPWAKTIVKWIPAGCGQTALRVALRLRPGSERRWLSIGSRYFLPRQPQVRRVGNGFAMKLHLPDDIEGRIFYTGRYERPLEMILARALQGGGFVDVGANSGYYSLYAARCGAKPVWAFEPFSITYRRLAENLALNTDLANLHAQQVAISNTAGTVRLYGDTTELGCTTMAPLETGGATLAEEVPCVPLDEVWQQMQRPALDLVKIDVEGGEHLVLTGMANLLAAKATAHIYVEMHPPQIRKLGGQPEQIPALLRQNGFTLYTQVADRLAPLDDAAFFASDAGHRFILGSLRGDWRGLRLPVRF